VTGQSPYRTIRVGLRPDKSEAPSGGLARVSPPREQADPEDLPSSVDFLNPESQRPFHRLSTRNRLCPNAGNVPYSFNFGSSPQNAPPGIKGLYPAPRHGSPRLKDQVQQLSVVHAGSLGSGWFVDLGPLPRGGTKFIISPCFFH